MIFLSGHFHSYSRVIDNVRVSVKTSWEEVQSIQFIKIKKYDERWYQDLRLQENKIINSREGKENLTSSGTIWRTMDFWLSSSSKRIVPLDRLTSGFSTLTVWINWNQNRDFFLHIPWCNKYTINCRTEHKNYDSNDIVSKYRHSYGKHLKWFKINLWRGNVSKVIKIPEATDLIYCMHCNKK